MIPKVATPFDASKRIHIGKWFFLVLCAMVSAIIFVLFFVQLPTENTRLGIDLLFGFLRNGDIVYIKTDGLRNPPWSVVPLMLLAQFPDKVAWGLLVYITAFVLILSVPRTDKKWHLFLAMFLVVLSFPTFRIFADAQIDVLVLAGMLGVIYAFPRQQPIIMAGGLLLASAKPQMVFIAFIVIGFYILSAWKPRAWLGLGVLLLAVVLPMMVWRGADWIAAMQGTYQAGTVMDITLGAALNRLGFIPEWVTHGARLIILGMSLWAAWRQRVILSRELVGLLMAASLLLAPYAGGNAPIILLAIAAVPLMYRRFWVGFLLLVSVNLLAIPHFTLAVDVSAYWTTAYILVLWLVLIWDVLTTKPTPHLLQNTPTDS